LCYYLVQHEAASGRRRPPTAVTSDYLLRNSASYITVLTGRLYFRNRQDSTYSDNAFTWPVPTTYVILDALDECRTRKEFQPWLATPEAQGLQLFLTSRKEEDIESSISSWLVTESIVPIRQAPVDNEAPVDNDTLTFIHSKIAEDKELQRWQYVPDVCIEIERKLME
jgi:hypothetical protein